MEALTNSTRRSKLIFVLSPHILLQCIHLLADLVLFPLAKKTTVNLSLLSLGGFQAVRGSCWGIWRPSNGTILVFPLPTTAEQFCGHPLKQVSLPEASKKQLKIPNYT